MEKLLVLTKYVEKIDKSVIEQQLGKTTEIALKEVHQLFANAEKEGTNFEEVQKLAREAVPLVLNLLGQDFLSEDVRKVLKSKILPALLQAEGIELGEIPKKILLDRSDPSYLPVNLHFMLKFQKIWLLIESLLENINFWKRMEGFELLCRFAFLFFPLENINDLVIDLRTLPKFWKLLQSGLIDAKEQLMRKRALFVLKQVMQFSEREMDIQKPKLQVFPRYFVPCTKENHIIWKKVWNTFFLVYETVNEFVVHLISGIWKEVEWLFIQCGKKKLVAVAEKRKDFSVESKNILMDISWLSILFYRVLDHANPSIKKWSILNFLMDKKFASNSNIKNQDASVDIAISEDFFFTKLAPSLSFAPLYRGLGSREIYSFYATLLNKIASRYVSRNKKEKCGKFMNRYVQYVCEEASKTYQDLDSRTDSQKVKPKTKGTKNEKEEMSTTEMSEEESTERMSASGLFLMLHGIANVEMGFEVFESETLINFGLIIRNRLAQMNHTLRYNCTVLMLQALERMLKVASVKYEDLGFFSSCVFSPDFTERADVDRMLQFFCPLVQKVDQIQQHAENSWIFSQLSSYVTAITGTNPPSGEDFYVLSQRIKRFSFFFRYLCLFSEKDKKRKNEVATIVYNLAQFMSQIYVRSYLPKGMAEEVIGAFSACLRHLNQFHVTIHDMSTFYNDITEKVEIGVEESLSFITSSQKEAQLQVNQVHEGVWKLQSYEIHASTLRSYLKYLLPQLSPNMQEKVIGCAQNLWTCAVPLVKDFAKNVKQKNWKLDFDCLRGLTFVHGISSVELLVFQRIHPKSAVVIEEMLKIFLLESPRPFNVPGGDPVSRDAWRVQNSNVLLLRMKSLAHLTEKILRLSDESGKNLLASSDGSLVLGMWSAMSEQLYDVSESELKYLLRAMKWLLVAVIYPTFPKPSTELHEAGVQLLTETALKSWKIVQNAGRKKNIIVMVEYINTFFQPAILYNPNLVKIVKLIFKNAMELSSDVFCVFNCVAYYLFCMWNHPSQNYAFSGQFIEEFIQMLNFCPNRKGQMPRASHFYFPLKRNQVHPEPWETLFSTDKEVHEPPFIPQPVLHSPKVFVYDFESLQNSKSMSFFLGFSVNGKRVLPQTDEYVRTLAWNCVAKLTEFCLTHKNSSEPSYKSTIKFLDNIITPIFKSLEEHQGKHSSYRSWSVIHRFRIKYYQHLALFSPLFACEDFGKNIDVTTTLWSKLMVDFNHRSVRQFIELFAVNSIITKTGKNLDDFVLKYLLPVLQDTNQNPDVLHSAMIVTSYVLLYLLDIGGHHDLVSKLMWSLVLHSSSHQAPTRRVIQWCTFKVATECTKSGKESLILACPAVEHMLKFLTENEESKKFFCFRPFWIAGTKISDLGKFSMLPRLLLDQMCRIDEEFPMEESINFHTFECCIRHQVTKYYAALIYPQTFAKEEASQDNEGPLRGGEEDYQKKITVGSHLFDDELSYRDHLLKSKKTQDIIVVASLIDKVPNLAGLTRTCEIFGATALVFASKAVEKAPMFQEISVTAEKWVPIWEVRETDLIKFLIGKKNEGYSLIGIEQTASSVDITEYNFPKKCVLLLGKEKEGIDAQYIHIVDQCIHIPQLGIIRSLNVHVAASIILWEYTRQNIVGATIEAPK